MLECLFDPVACTQGKINTIPFTWLAEVLGP